MAGLLEAQLGRGTLVLEGQGGQQGNNGMQIGHQTFVKQEGKRRAAGAGNAGMLAAQQAGRALPVWLKVQHPNLQLKEQYGLMHAGLFQVSPLS